MQDLATSYQLLKAAHVTLVLCSGALFGLRGAAVLGHHRWPMTRPAKLSSMVIDTLLLMAGVALAVLVSVQPLRDAWLAAKLLLLVVYIVLGSFALKRARTPRGRLLCCVAALSVYGHIIATAVLHHPLGMIALFIDSA
jgi:uncharacterized membrane protein SirB2